MPFPDGILLLKSAKYSYDSKRDFGVQKGKASCFVPSETYLFSWPHLSKLSFFNSIIEFENSIFFYIIQIYPLSHIKSIYCLKTNVKILQSA